MAFLDRPGGSLGPWVRSWSRFVDTTFTWIAEGEVEVTPWTTPNIYIQSKVSSSWATLLLVLSAQNAPLRQKLNVKWKSQPKCMENVWSNFFTWIFQNDETIWFKCNVQQCCRVKTSLSFCKRQFSNHLVKFSDKLKIKTFDIKHEWEMYGKQFSIEYFILMPPYNLNLIYSKVVKL